MASLVPSRPVLAVALAALLVALAWQLGERRGERRAEALAASADDPPDGSASASGRAAAIDATSDPAGGSRGEPRRGLRGESGPRGESPGGSSRTTSGGVMPGTSARTAADERSAALLDEVEALEGQRDMLNETVRALRVELERADRLSADERAELELYRRVGVEGTAAGLAIDTIERRDGDPATGDPASLRVTLVQTRGRDRVEGRVDVLALGADTPMLAPESSREVEAALAAPGAVIRSVPFDLRFFETLEIPLGEAFPPVVEVRVVPEGRPHAPFRTRFRQEAVRILD